MYLPSQYSADRDVHNPPKVRFTQDAERDIAQAAEWYSGRNRMLATRFLAAVGDTTSRIAAQPLAHRIAFDDVRRANFPRR
jgi:plasmid stabilization system protein ParE